MFYKCPNESVLNTAYIEFVSPVQRVEPSEENNLQNPVYAFFVRTNSGYVISFEEEELTKTEILRIGVLAACESDPK